MALQPSGTIGIGDLQTEFTSSDGELSHYYRNGPIVPGDIPGGLTPGNTRPGNTIPGNPRPGNTNPCVGGTLNTGVPGSSTMVMNNVTMSPDWSGNISGLGRGTQSYSSGGPRWSRQLDCFEGNGCNTNGFSTPCNGELIHWRGVPAVVGGSKTVPCLVNNVFNPPTTNPPTTNPPTTNPPTTNPPTTNLPTAINTQVPTSGTISLSNFYGARLP